MECSRCGMPARPDERICRTCGAALTPVTGQNGGQAEGSATPESGSAENVTPFVVQASAPNASVTAEGSDEASAAGAAAMLGAQQPADAGGSAPAVDVPAASVASAAGSQNETLARDEADARGAASAPGTASAQGAPRTQGAQGAAVGPEQGGTAAPAGGVTWPGYGYPYGYGAYGANGAYGAHAAYGAYGAPGGYGAHAQHGAAYGGQPTAYPAAAYGHPGYAYAGYSYPGYYYVPQPPKTATGETYRTVLAWIVTIGSGLAAVGALLLGMLSAVAYARGGLGLAVLGQSVGLFGAALLGGITGLYFGITALMHRPSLRFSFPHWTIFLGLAVLAIGGDVVIWNLAPAPGPALAVLPLFVLAGLLPALAILAYTARRLNYPTTWRHVMLSLIFGAVVATVVASLLEVAAYFVIVVVLQAFGFHLTFDPNFLQNLNPSNPGEALAFLLLGSLAAPLIEEGLKPLGAVLVMPRLRGPNEVFLVGLAAGLGFAVVETLGYFGMGEADWVSVAIARLGAGLVHGVGAGMGALGWYYLIRGKGVSRRWLRGFGALAYAMVQHAIFNASNLLGVIPTIGVWLNHPMYLGRLPLDGGTWVAFVLYAAILVVLIVVTGRLRAIPASGVKPDSPGVGGAGGAVEQTAQAVPGGVR